MARTTKSPIRSVPVEYDFVQSNQQAFYFVNSATIDGEAITEEDVIIAYNNNVIVGSRYWYGTVTDVPAMGVVSSMHGSISDAFAGYCTSGDHVVFKIWDSSEQELVDMVADVTTDWNNNSYTFINLSEVQEVLPTEISFQGAYPNPFNPTTMLKFSVPTTMEVEVVVYDMMGRMVSEISNDIFEAGTHDLYWDASHNSSGIYFVKFLAGSHVTTQKLMLVK
tara:strand:- start:3696 stop:4361 length:666 start_codon:yes stop_codon:yes gene_type:complete